MDTGTVMQVIKMLDVKINKLSKDYHENENFIKQFNTKEELPEMLEKENDLYNAGVNPLLELRNHLQGFIEAELNAVENQSAEQ